MSHWIIVPVLLPAMLAPLLAWIMRYDIVLARAISIAGTAFLVAVSVGLFMMTLDGEVHIYRLGNWAPPFGIMLALDRLSSLLVLVTTVLALLVVIHVAATDWDRKGRHFHALFQFQLMGICGAFLTGDAFNLFVFFEVLLIASYGLMLHGGGRARLRAGLQYVIMNLGGSTLFLFALGTLYASTGTLNIADLAIKVREIPLEDAALVRVAAMLLMIVFAIKAALFPVQFWLPGSYSNAPAPVAALFAIMTKIGAYAILRVYTIAFGPDVAAIGGMPGEWLFWGALVTILVGAIGVLGARRLMLMISFSVVGSMGALMLAVSAFTPEAGTAALYYLLQSTFAAAALFLLADLVVSRRPEGDVIRASAPIGHDGLFGALFMVAAIGMAGMPPLSGFLGKLFVLDVIRDMPYAMWGWAVILVGSLLTIVGFARAGSSFFWKPYAHTPEDNEKTDDAPETPVQKAPPLTALALAPTVCALLILALLSVFAGPVSDYAGSAARDLFNPEAYLMSIPETIPDIQKGGQ